jgi:hypothetical protein
MDRMTVKTSTIFIAKGGKTRVYSSMNDIPPQLRKELDESTNSFNSATILIADRRGREEIVRALNGLPSSLRSRLAQSLNSNSNQTQLQALPIPQPGPEQLRPIASALGFVRRYWLEMTIPSAVGFIVWAAFHFR